MYDNKVRYDKTKTKRPEQKKTKEHAKFLKILSETLVTQNIEI